ncbi:class I SAM-dependent methyltransferase [Palleronia sp. KMU-117]|uniref:class I SAM-dependent methyltransferase n=1 Tax=Palleronia sp. KMU-117 TaxID=3434108 RepID=UPI003D718A90
MTEAGDSRRDINRGKLLSLLPKGGRGAEVGVWAGDFSARILDIAAPRELHLVDPWEFMPEFPRTGFGREQNSGKMDEMHAAVRTRFADDPRVVIHRARSEAALATFDDGYLDWIYIDGNHHAPFVDRDIELAQMKVRADGIIAGDDYLWRDGGALPVKTAVDRLVASLAKNGAFTRFGQQWLVMRSAQPV